MGRKSAVTINIDQFKEAMSKLENRIPRSFTLTRIPEFYLDEVSARFTDGFLDDEKRVVPVHPALIEFGFVEYVERLRARNESRLFPKVDYDTRQQIAGGYSRLYGRYLKTIGVKKGKEINFHSYRHTFIDALRSAGFRDDEFNFLVGHSNAKRTTTANYGILSEGILSDRVKLVNAVNYPGLDLSHLRVS